MPEPQFCMASRLFTLKYDLFQMRLTGANEPRGAPAHLSRLI